MKFIPHFLHQFLAASGWRGIHRPDRGLRGYFPAATPAARQSATQEEMDMRDPERALPLLMQKLEELYALATSAGDRTFPLGDHFSRLVLFFFAKQNEHTSAILLLAAHGLYRDAGLIARSMMEGVFQLLWSTHDPQIRAARWEEFSAVSSWRKMRKHEESGEPVDVKTRELIEEALRKSGPQFYCDSARKKIADGRPPKDPYCRIWTGHNYYSEIFDQMRGKIWRLTTYSSLSSWHHWEPEGFGEAIEWNRQTNECNYREPSARAGAEALSTAFACLTQTLAVLNQHFQLGLDAKIEALKDDYSAAFDEKTAEAG
jgi:hypothetical protein